MSRIIGAQREFHDAQYARDWAARFDPTAERLELFGAMLAQLRSRVLPVRNLRRRGSSNALTVIVLASIELQSRPLLWVQGANIEIRKGFERRKSMAKEVLE